MSLYANNFKLIELRLLLFFPAGRLLLKLFLLRIQCKYENITSFLLFTVHGLCSEVDFISTICLDMFKKHAETCHLSVFELEHSDSIFLLNLAEQKELNRVLLYSIAMDSINAVLAFKISCSIMIVLPFCNGYT